MRDLLDWFYSDVEIKEWAVIIWVNLWCDDCDDVGLLPRLHNCGELLVRGTLCQRLRFMFLFFDNHLSQIELVSFFKHNPEIAWLFNY